MNENLTAITILLDRSGSMCALQNDVVEGVNAFIRDQQNIKGEATLSLVQFDDRYEENYLNLPLDRAEFLSDKTYQPRGMTALLDAMGRCIKETKRRIKAMDKNRRPGKVIFLVFTDGYENASKEWTAEKLSTLVKKQEEKHSWKFVFLGANIDSFAVGSSLGISAGSTANYVASAKGIRSALYASSQAVSNARSMDQATYTANDGLLDSVGVSNIVDENNIVGTDFDFVADKATGESQ